MILFKNSLGLNDVKLNRAQKVELKKKLISTDIKRINFFAAISFFACTIFILLGYLIPDKLPEPHIYRFSDSIYLLISLYVLSGSLLKKHITLKKFYNQKAIQVIFPVATIAWSTSVLALSPGEIINALTFFIVVFLISFTLFISLTRFILYLSVSLSTYSTIVLLTHQPYISEAFLYLIIGAILSFLFYHTFQHSRITSQAAIIKMNDLNAELETKVKNRTRAMQKLNFKLGDEVEQRKNAERKLRNALKNLKESNNLKSEFLANISHEIRTPLNSIIGFSEMLTEDGVDTESKKEYQKLIASNTMYLLSTFDDIFDASLVKTNSFKPVNKPVLVSNFLKVIKYEANGIIIKHDKEHLNFSIEAPDNETLTLITDDHLLKKALLRLIDNAFKFTNKGYVKLVVQQFSNKIIFSIEDTGIGIKEADYKKIMMPFVQGDGSFSRGYGGSGLGLNIVSGISKALKYVFEFTSEVGSGSEFRLIVPLKKSEDSIS